MGMESRRFSFPLGEANTEKARDRFRQTLRGIYIRSAPAITIRLANEVNRDQAENKCRGLGTIKSDRCCAGAGVLSLPPSAHKWLSYYYLQPSAVEKTWKPASYRLSEAYFFERGKQMEAPWWAAALRSSELAQTSLFSTSPIFNSIRIREDLKNTHKFSGVVWQ